HRRCVLFVPFVVGHPRVLLSFPTRRSSDLALQAGTPGWDYLVDYVGDVKPSLTVIDTLAKTASRYDENTPADMSKYLHECDRLRDRKSTRLNSSHVKISYAVLCLKKTNNPQ